MGSEQNFPAVLVVSGDSFKNSQIKRALKDHFYPLQALDSFSAVDWLKTIKVDAVILDQKSLEKTWAILCQHIRKLPDYSITPILLITGNQKKSFILEAFNYGVSDFIDEPIDDQEIYQRVMVAIHSRSVNKKVALLTGKFKKNITDVPLETPLPQRFIMTESSIRMLIEAQSKHTPLCLIMLEIDQFNKLLESYSTANVKEFVGSIEKFLKGCLRKFDLLMPQGAGRYLLLVPKTSHRAGMLIAETMRNEIHDAFFVIGKDKIAITLSIGLTSYNEKEPLPENAYGKFGSLLEKVDSALKEAKRKGDRIISKEDLQS